MAFQGIYFVYVLAFDLTFSLTFYQAFYLTSLETFYIGQAILNIMWNHPQLHKFKKIKNSEAMKWTIHFVGYTQFHHPRIYWRWFLALRIPQWPYNAGSSLSIPFSRGSFGFSPASSLWGAPVGGYKIVGIPYKIWFRGTRYLKNHQDTQKLDHHSHFVDHAMVCCHSMTGWHLWYPTFSCRRGASWPWKGQKESPILTIACFGYLWYIDSWKNLQKMSKKHSENCFMPKLHKIAVSTLV